MTEIGSGNWNCYTLYIGYVIGGVYKIWVIPKVRLREAFIMRDPIENISRLQTKLNDLQLENQI